MHQFTAAVLVWLEYFRAHPLIAVGVAALVVAFYFASTWKPKATRDAETRLRQIREDSRDRYRQVRPPGR